MNSFPSTAYSSRWWIFMRIPLLPIAVDGSFLCLKHMNRMKIRNKHLTRVLLSVNSLHVLHSSHWLCIQFFLKIRHSSIISLCSFVLLGAACTEDSCSSFHPNHSRALETFLFLFFFFHWDKEDSGLKGGDRPS